jgi:hypothetical protein
MGMRKKHFSRARPTQPDAPLTGLDQEVVRYVVITLFLSNGLGLVNRQHASKPLAAHPGQEINLNYAPLELTCRVGQSV